MDHGGATLSIPKIDFSSARDLQPGSDDWDGLRAQVWKAMEAYGCFEAIFPALFPPALRPALFSALEGLFAKPLENKIRNRYDEPGHGHIRYPNCPLYEALGIKDAMNFASVEGFAKLFWPQGHPSFSEAVHAAVKETSKLDYMARRMMMESLGVEKYFGVQNDSIYYLFRMLNYKSPRSKDATIGLRPHTDVTLLTVVFQNNVNGLQVQTEDQRWLPALTSPNSFLVMAGDSLMAWSNGRIRAPRHRVMMEGDEDRYSVSMFTIQKPGCMVQTPEELVDEEHPLLFKPFNTIDYFRFRVSPDGLRALMPLKAYCGIQVSHDDVTSA